MRNNEFTESVRDTVHDNITVSNGTTAYAETWTVPEAPAANKLEFTNTGSGAYICSNNFMLPLLPALL